MENSKIIYKGKVGISKGCGHLKITLIEPMHGSVTVWCPQWLVCLSFPPLLFSIQAQFRRVLLVKWNKMSQMSVLILVLVCVLSSFWMLALHHFIARNSCEMDSLEKGTLHDPSCFLYIFLLILIIQLINTCLSETGCCIKLNGYFILLFYFTLFFCFLYAGLIRKQ